MSLCCCSRRMGCGSSRGLAVASNSASAPGHPSGSKQQQHQAPQGSEASSVKAADMHHSGGAAGSAGAGSSSGSSADAAKGSAAGGAGGPGGKGDGSHAPFLKHVDKGFSSTDGMIAAALRQKRKAHGVVIYGESAASIALEDLSKRMVPKDERVRGLISTALKDNVFFAELGESERLDLVNAMDSKEVAAGTLVIQQGDPGDNFYCIESGKFEIVVGDRKVADWGDGTKNRTFGELALLYNLPRAATVRAVTEAKLWFIDRMTFRSVLAAANQALHHRLKAALKRGILEELPEEQLDKIADVATIVKYNKGDQIIKKGEEGEVLFIIESGSVLCRHLPGGQSNNILHAGDYFGERALLRKQPRAADVYAESDVSLIAIHKEDFEVLLGHLRELFEFNLGMRLLLCVPLFAYLSDAQRTDIFNWVKVISVPEGQPVLAQGAVPNQFFILKEGSVSVRQALPGSSGEAGASAASAGSSEELSSGKGSSAQLTDISLGSSAAASKEIGTLQPGNWFPDKELDTQAPSAHSYLAVGGEVQCFTITREVYARHLAPIKRALQESAARAAAAQAASASNTARSAGSRGSAVGDSPAGGAGSSKQQPGKLMHTGSSAALLQQGAGAGSRGGAGGSSSSSGSPSMRRSMSSGDMLGEALPGAGGAGSARQAASVSVPGSTDVRGRQGSMTGPGSPSSSAAAGGGGAAAGRKSSATGADGGVPGISTTSLGSEAARKEVRRLSAAYMQSKAAHAAAAGGAGMAPPGSEGATGETLPAPRKRLGIPMKELEQKATLGTGTFGRVRLVLHRKTNKVYALKMLQKQQIVALKQQKNIMNERDILFRLDHPFIIKLFDTFKDWDKLYMLLELVQGGELFARLQNSNTPGRISAAEARFYSACVLDVFHALHRVNIIYRDLKPENLLIDSEGYIKVVDFGFAKIVRDRTFTLCGTPEYLAPELVLSKGHDKGVDYWALGVLLYEMVVGYSPFADRVGNDQMVICRNILKGEVDFPHYVKDRELKDIILRLLVKDIAKRLGCTPGGTMDVKEHPFFTTIDWLQLRKKALMPPWRPKLAGALDTSHFDEYDEDEDGAPYKDDGSNWDASF